MSPRRLQLLDRIGATGSLVCALHCAVLPLLIAALPAFGVALWLGDGVEAVFITFASLFGVAVLAWSYRRHRILRALALLVPGLAALWAAILYAPLHHSVLPHALVITTGGALVGLAHLVNLRLNHGYQHGHRHGVRCVH